MAELYLFRQLQDSLAYEKLDQARIYADALIRAAIQGRAALREHESRSDIRKRLCKVVGVIDDLAAVREQIVAAVSHEGETG